ncbi:metallophosphoesterase family protein [Paenibacillus sp. ISL-20]|uniref:metallophosphoesterase family protein n=1 Tax=Paenibacillus sp. ISL-20 TaxID=2819163 RepID=UPI001BE55AD2|nr:metallophosphoesterase family protein [Paenibacillus sp. ISL-20]MBT2762391.1 serine/threonine protein phosphatase [Paenibacillus sp. ISL-20]
MKKSRTLVISDIHGCDQELIALLKDAEFDSSKDQLILLGDYVDRGLRSKEAVSLVQNLVQHEHAIALQGNHDHRFVNVVAGLATSEEIAKFWDKGGVQTFASYCGDVVAGSEEELVNCSSRIRTTYSEHIRFLKDLPMYYEDEHFIYVHAGLNPSYDEWKLQSPRDFLYIREEFYMVDKDRGKTVIFGHTKTVDLHGSPEVWYGPGKIGIDGGCAFGYQLNGLEIMDGQVNRIYRQKAKVESK